MNKIVLYIRKETLKNEYRTPLIPHHVSSLIQNGFTVYIQSSLQRIYNDDTYRNTEAIVTDEPWYSEYFDHFKNNMIVIGLKELSSSINHLSGHTHLYFSHSFKGQPCGCEIVEQFKNTGSFLYDIEYITDETNKRLISFSYYAGVSGCLIGLLHYYNQLIYPLKPFKNIYQALFYLYIHIFRCHKPYPSVKIIGNGECTRGVLFVLDILKVPYILLDRTQTSCLLSLDSDLFFNCIKLDQNNPSVFINEESAFNRLDKRKITIVDISCDVGKANNPISIYEKETTWEEPIYHHPSNIDIISISNLPSLLPEESSEYFSEKLYTLLTNPQHIGWKRSLEFYLSLNSKNTKIKMNLQESLNNIDK